MLNDLVEWVFRFTTDKHGGLNTSMMLQGYVVISKTVSVITIAMFLYFFQPWLCLLVLLVPPPTVWIRTAGQKMKFEFMKNNTGLFRQADYFQDVMLSFAGKELKTFGLYDLSQNPARYLTFTAGDNVHFGDTAHMREDERIRETLDFVGLEEPDSGTLLGKETGGAELSGGQ